MAVPLSLHDSASLPGARLLYKMAAAASPPPCAPLLSALAELGTITQYY